MAIKEVKAGEKYKLELLCIHNSGKVIIFETPTGDHLPFRESDLECVSPEDTSEHSTVGTLSPIERSERLWNGMWDVLFGEASQRYAADYFKAMQNHIKSMNPDTTNVTKNTETAPKYDPCRLFRKGDKVRVVERNGRHYDTMFDEKTWIVAKDERNHSTLPRDVQVNDGNPNSHCYSVPFFYLELVTPVEELEPYKVTESSDYYGVDKDDLEVEAAIFWKKSHPQAKAAAEAECKRLNEEYRKENAHENQEN